jgi:hypothetical protein
MTEASTFDIVVLLMGAAAVAKILYDLYRNLPFFCHMAEEVGKTPLEFDRITYL